MPIWSWRHSCLRLKVSWASTCCFERFMADSMECSVVKIQIQLSGLLDELF